MAKPLLQCFAMLALVSAACAQEFTPHVGYVYPAGGKQGSSFEVTLGGQFLDGVNNAVISGGNAKASIVEYTKPITQGQFNNLREELKKLMDKKSASFRQKFRGSGKGSSKPSSVSSWSADDEKKLDEIKKKLALFVKRPANPAIAETVRLQVTLDSDAEPGEHEIRLATALGLTNPLVFNVGQVSEVSKKPIHVINDQIKDKAARFRMFAEDDAPKSPTTITLPATVNGQVSPGGVDRYRFHAKEGQRIVVNVNARQLIPYISDAVPGWFQASVALYDSKGKELAYDDHYRFHQDPVLYCEIPADGDYMMEIRDSIYRGREDFVYRVTVGETPFITSIFPLGGPAGTSTSIEVKGWNLPTTKLTQESSNTPGVRLVSVRNGDKISNSVPFAFDTLPECLEEEPNNAPANAQRVRLPIIVNGRIEKPGDTDVFRIEGRAGDELVAEVNARRLDSPVDSSLTLTDANGKEIAFNDDREDKGSGLNTHHADSYLRAKLPETGAYYLHLNDTQHKGGSEFAYRLRISAPQPDFALRATPSSISIRGGTSAAVTVYALRKDGFTGEIELSLKDAPAGFTLSGALIPANKDKARFTISAPPSPTSEPVSVSFQGRAKVDGQEIVRAAVPAEDMMQAFAYRHLVPSKETKLSVSGRFMPRNNVKILTDMPIKIPVGGTARVLVGLPTTTMLGKVDFELSDPPAGIELQEVKPSGSGSELVLETDADFVKPGFKGNLIVTAFASRSMGGPKSKQMPKQHFPIGTLPAIPFEIVAR